MYFEGGNCCNQKGLSARRLTASVALHTAFDGDFFKTQNRKRALFLQLGMIDDEMIEMSREKALLTSLFSLHKRELELKSRGFMMNVVLALQ